MKASIVHVGGFRPTNEPYATNFGMHALAAPGRAWPESGGKSMLFVCQLNLTAAPVIPKLLAGVQLITFFLDFDDLGQLGDENGEHWRLNTYSSLEGLVPLAKPAGAPTLRKGFECRWEAAEDSEDDDDNLARTKIGGYPTMVQAEPWWDFREHPANPAYCMQINSEEKAGLKFGDGGVLHVARGTADGCSARWFLDWQFY